MSRYCIELHKPGDLLAEHEFWRLHNKYAGFGVSDSSRNDELLGEFYFAFGERDEIPSVKQLQKEFPNLSIVDISRRVSELETAIQNLSHTIL